ncbi:MAG: nitroreductase family protein [Clostridia bacterium]|nr:nitroreductase family protein [Clostridia bacterium]
MNETIDLLLKRRSIRKYLPEQIDPAHRERILETALYAPSGRNLQYPRFLVMQNRKMLDELNALIVREFAKWEIKEGQYQNRIILLAREQPDHNFFYHAPTLIHVVSPKSHGNSMADSACALENMQIAAIALGLGSCWINTPHWLTDNRAFRDFMEPLGLRPDEDVFGSLAVGRPAGPLPGPLPRKEGRIIRIE